MLTREMKDSGVEWIGNIPENWKTMRLKNALFRRKEIVSEYKNGSIDGYEAEKRFSKEYCFRINSDICRMISVSCE